MVQKMQSDVKLIHLRVSQDDYEVIQQATLAYSNQIGKVTTVTAWIRFKLGVGKGEQLSNADIEQSI